jgi:hypothetical protein
MSLQVVALTATGNWQFIRLIIMLTRVAHHAALNFPWQFTQCHANNRASVKKHMINSSIPGIFEVFS